MDEAIQKLTHATLAQLTRAGAVSELRAVGVRGGWELAVSFGAEADARLAAQRSGEVRLFARFESLVSYLKGLGVERFAVDSSGFADETAPERRRPDRAEALRRAHRAAVQETPIPPELEAALLEADSAAAVWQSQKELAREWATIRAGLAQEEASR